MNTLKKSTVTIFLLALMATVAMLSYFIFSNQSLRLDESQSLWQTSHGYTMVLSIIAEDVHVPFYHTLLHAWQFLFGNSVEGARLMSLIFFLLGIPAIYLLGKTAHSQQVGIMASLLFAISPFMNWYGNEIRMYSLFTLLAILSHYFFIRIYTQQTEGAWWGYLGTALLGIFTHYFFWLILLTQAIFFFAAKKQFPTHALRNFIVVAITLVASFLPWALYVFSSGSAENSRPLLSPPTSINLFNTFSNFLIGFQNDHLNTLFVSLWPLAILFIFFALQKNRKVTKETFYFAASIIIPITLAFIISSTIRPLFLSRYLIFTLPPLYILISWLISLYPPRLSFITKSALVAIMIFGLSIEAISSDSPVKENYKQATEYLERNTEPHDVIVVSAPFTVYPVEYYYRGSLPIHTLPIWDRFQTGPVPPFIAENLEEEVKTVRDDYARLWLLLSYDQGYENELRLYFDSNYHRLEHVEFSAGLNLYLYKIRYDLTAFTDSPES